MRDDGEFVSEVRDNGRRGEPLPGCDCIRCFGYCMVDRDVAAREAIERLHGQRSPSRAASAALTAGGEIERVGESGRYRGKKADTGDAFYVAATMQAAVNRDRGVRLELDDDDAAAAAIEKTLDTRRGSVGQ